MNQGHVILSHGLESGPNATKVTRLAEVAEAAGWSSERPDYTHLGEPAARVELLLERCAKVADQLLILVGSSMGAYISGIASTRVSVHGAFLLAPPVAVPNREAFELRSNHRYIVHGWDDELIPAEQVVAFAQQRRVPLLLLPDDHRLSASIDVIAAAFGEFLHRCRA